MHEFQLVMDNLVLPISAWIVIAKQVLDNLVLAIASWIVMTRLVCLHVLSCILHFEALCLQSSVVKLQPGSARLQTQKKREISFMSLKS